MAAESAAEVRLIPALRRSELNKKLEEAEKEKNKAATREELMERSYKMAAKYLNPDKDTVQEKAVGKEPTETVPVQRAEYQTTSGLSQ